ncbi:MAG: hypothetical protein IJX55_04510 [Clostridia bacterium]|nr:hypothetical protein [Clostridia bacterium]
MNNNSTFVQEQENVLAGVVGAFLFSLVGGILWFVLYQIGYLAAVSGLVGVICAVKGYTFFAKTKNESKKCLIISIITTVVVLAISWYFCVAYDIYLAYQEWFATGEVDFTYTFFESVQVVPYFFAEPEILIGYLKDLGFGILFAGLGVIYYLSLREKKMKRQAAEEAAKAAMAEAQAENEPAPEEAEEIKYDKDVE